MNRYVNTNEKKKNDLIKEIIRKRLYKNLEFNLGEYKDFYVFNPYMIKEDLFFKRNDFKENRDNISYGYNNNLFNNYLLLGYDYYSSKEFEKSSFIRHKYYDILSNRCINLPPKIGLYSYLDFKNDFLALDGVIKVDEDVIKKYIEEYYNKDIIYDYIDEFILNKKNNRIDKYVKVLKK